MYTKCCYDHVWPAVWSFVIRYPSPPQDIIPNARRHTFKVPFSVVDGDGETTVITFGKEAAKTRQNSNPTSDPPKLCHKNTEK